VTRRHGVPATLRGVLLSTALALAACEGVPVAGGEQQAAMAASPAPANQPTTTEPQSNQEQRMQAEEIAAIEIWRTQRVARLTAPDGWLTLVGLQWLGEGRNRLGSAADAEVHFPANAPAALGVITRQGEALTVEPAADVALRAGDHPVKGPTPLASDAAGEPTVVSLGSISFFVIKRGERWAVRIKDAESPVRTGFRGLDYYPVDGGWRVPARLESAPKATTIPVPNILGEIEQAASPGSVVFQRDGHEVRLQAIDEGDGRLFLVFGDETNGKGTYGGGRFVYADPPAAGSQSVVVDFNQAYNPPCVFTPFATCPLPPQGNRMPFPVAAGEKLWAGYHHH
jgi:hypothetical protein